MGPSPGTPGAREDGGLASLPSVCVVSFTLTKGTEVLAPASTLDFRRMNPGGTVYPKSGGSPCGHCTLGVIVSQAVLVFSHHSKDGFGPMFRD